MQVSNSTVKYDNQTLGMVLDMKDAGMTCPEIASILNDAGVVKIKSRNAFTGGDVSHLIHRSYPQSQKRIAPSPNQVIDMGVLFSKFKLYLGVEDGKDS